MELSKRLQKVADGVTAGNRLADIGTDHGYIPIFLVKTGRIPSAIAMDINEGPILRAKEHIEAAGFSDKIETRRSNGFDALQKGEADSVVIAGMGGALMEDILTRGEAVLDGKTELVLQPQSEIFKVRHCLHRMKYRIIKEEMVKEEGKYYFIIKAVPGIQTFKEEYFYEYGEYLLNNRDPLMLEYLHKEAEKYEEIRKKLALQNTEAAEKRNREIEEKLCLIKKVCNDEM